MGAASEHHDEISLGEGDWIGPEHRVRRTIGRGATGVVYEVEHASTGERLAAKLLRAELAASPLWMARLEREAFAASRIDHPSIARVLVLGRTENGQPFLLEELVEGVDLATLLSRGPLDPADALAIGYHAARALGAVHAHGIVHRDLKPAHLLLCARRAGVSDDAPVLRIIDFGSAKALAPETPRLTATGAIVGTPLYMSPEQAEDGSAIDARADVYSLGAILFELVTGLPPFLSTNPLDILLKHRQQPPLAPSSVAGHVPSEIDAVILRALAKTKEDRYSNMEQLARALSSAAKRIGAELDVLPSPEAVRARAGAPKPTKRSRLRARPVWRRSVLLAFAVAVLLLLTGLGAWRSLPAAFSSRERSDGSPHAPSPESAPMRAVNERSPEPAARQPEEPQRDREPPEPPSPEAPDRRANTKPPRSASLPPIPDRR